MATRNDWRVHDEVARCDAADAPCRNHGYNGFASAHLIRPRDQSGRDGAVIAPQARIVFSPSLRIEQAKLGFGKFVKNALRNVAIATSAQRAHKSHLPRRRIGNHISILLERSDAQKPVVVRRLLGRRYTEKFVICIERFSHDSVASLDA